MRYIAVKYNLEDHWYPRSDPQKQARVDEFLNWQHACVRKPCKEVVQCLILSEVDVGNYPTRPLDDEKIKAERNDVSKAVKHIAEYFLGDKQFIAGDEISGADIIGAMEIIHLTIVKEEYLYTCNEKVNAWMNRIRERLQPHFDDSLIRLNSLKQMFNDAT